MVRIGVIGCGMITEKRHAPEYAANENARLRGWFDVLPERAEAMRALYSGRAFADWKELILSGECDAVSICSPNRLHAPMATFALDHGLHVLCEKPMATTKEECRAMVDAARASGKNLFIGLNQRLAPAHRKAKELIASGEIGKVLTFSTVFGHSGPEVWTKSSNTWFYRKDAAAFGALFDLGLHKIDLIDDLLGDSFTQVAALTGTLDKKDADGRAIDVEDNVVCSLRTHGGVLGQMAASWTYYGGESNATRIYGTKGALCIYEENEPLSLRRLSGEKIVYDVGEIQTNERQFSSGVIDLFIEDIEKKRKASISGESVYRAMKTAFAAAESARTGKLIDIDQ